jgi:hypothetical protein
MATYSVNVTASTSYFPDNLSGSQVTVFAVTNSLAGASYFGLETVPPFGWYYSGSTPSISGSFSYNSGIIDLIKDDYKMLAVVKPGGGIITFTPAVSVTGSNLLTRGTGGSVLGNLLLDRYVGAAAAYSLRQLSTTYEGPAIRVRRAIDNSEQNIGFTSTNLDTSALLTFSGVSSTLPVNHSGGAVVAYSLRYVSTAYSGPVVRVRRSNDNAELDFTPSEIMNGTLVSWVGVGNDGSVTTWYDQSGNSKNCVQSTAARQPKIVSAGALVTENGKPTLTFGGAASLVASSVSSYQPTTVYFAASFLINGTSAVQFIFDSFDTNTSARLGFAFFGSTFDYFSTPGGDVMNGGYTFTAQPRIFSIVYNGADSSLNLNSVFQYSGNPGTGYINGTLTVGSRYLGDLRTGGNIAEFIIQNSDNPTNRFSIESNMNNYYTAFSSDAFVTTWYDQSGNSNHIAQSSATAQPTIITGSSLVQINNIPALFFDNINDNLVISASNSSSLAMDYHSSVLVHKVGNVWVTGSTTSYYSPYERRQDISAPTNYAAFGHANDRKVAYWNGSVQVVSNSVMQLNTQYLWNLVGDTTASGSIYINNSLALSSATSIGTKTLPGNPIFQVGNWTSLNEYVEKYIQELVIWPSIQTPNLSRVNTNVNSYYKIY